MGRVSRVLDWSKPLKDQPAFVVAAVRAALKPRRAYSGDGGVGADSGDGGVGADSGGAGDNDGGPNDAGAGNGPSDGAGEGTDTYSNTALASLPGSGPSPATTPTTPDWIGPKPSDPLNTAWKKIGAPVLGTPSVGKTFTLAELPELNRGGAVVRALRVVRRSSK
jgi:hypothetical protein